MVWISFCAKSLKITGPLFSSVLFFFVVFVFAFALYFDGFNFPQTKLKPPKNRPSSSNQFGPSATRLEERMEMGCATRVCTQSERFDHMRKVCAAHKSETRSGVTSGAFVVDPEHHLEYCNIAKCSSGTWKKLLAVSTKKGKKMRKDFSPHYPHTLLYRGLKLRRVNNKKTGNNTRFFIVRNPLTRFLSAYKDKMVTDNQPIFKYTIRSHIKKTLHPKTYNKTSRPAKISVTEFADFVTGKKGIRRIRQNAHWVPQKTRCNPCYTKYDKSQISKFDLTN